MLTVFEKVIAGDFEGSFVYRDDICVAFLDINPINAGHVLVVPRKPIARLTELESPIAAHLFVTAQRILEAIEKSGLMCEGANIFLSDGEVAGQEVPHVHLHIVPRFKGDGISLSFGRPFEKPIRNELNRIAARIASSMMSTEDFKDLIAKVTRWAEDQSGILGAMLVGSYAHGTARPDSDVDLMLFTSDPSIWLKTTDWLSQFGQVEKVEREQWGSVTSLRVYYRDSFEVEFNFASLLWASIDPVDAETLRVVSDGVRVLYDPHGALKRLTETRFSVS
ncbi:MAG: HIT domain-containing protein [Bdellovibrionales bacterium]|nr:HIT domain-containing protein [Bdellovibrionales bacterium]